jgi:competence protein ComEC
MTPKREGRAERIPGVTRPPVPRPLVGLALTFILGILCGLRWSAPVPALLVSIGLALLVLWGVRRRPGSVWLLYGSVFLAGVAHLRLATHGPSQRNLSGLLASEAEYLHIEAVVAGDPVVGKAFNGGRQAYRFPVRVTGVNRLGTWQRASGTVACRWQTASERVPAYGDRWFLTGLLKQPDPTLRGPQRFRCRMEVDDRETQFMSAGHGHVWVDWCLRGRRACAAILSRGLSGHPEHRGLLLALLLGYRSELPDRLHDVFSLTGTLHIFAISGLHVGVMALLLVGLLRSCGVSRQFWFLYLAPLLLIYVVATGMKTSAVRAMVMACVFWLAPLLGRKPDAATALPFAALLILAWAPTQIADVGFLLSFTVVTGLVVMVPRLLSPFESLVRPDPWMAEPEPRLRGWARSGARYLVSILAVSVAAWTASAPLTAFFFNLFSPIALLGNILVVPLAFLVVLCGCLSLISGLFSLFLVEVFNHANRVFIGILLGGIEALVKVPNGHWFVVSPPAAMVLFYYGVITVFLLARGWRARLAVLATGLLVIGGSATYAQAKAEPGLDVIDVEDGLAVLLDIPRAPDVLIDAGPAFFARRVTDHLKRAGVNRLAALVLSHADTRHVGGAMDVMRMFRVDEVWCSPDPGRSSVYRAVLDEAKARGIPVRMLRRGDSDEFSGGIMWEVLHPAQQPSYASANNASLVLRLGRGGWSALVMGGAGNEVEQELLGLPLTLAATDLVIGNDPGPDGCSVRWLQAVAPAHIVVSAGGRRRKGFPALSVIDRLENSGADLRRTDREGTIHLETIPAAGKDAASLSWR